MAIRETAAVAPGALALPKNAKDVHQFAIALESTLAPMMSAISLCADWIEHRQTAITASYEIVDETVIFADATAGAITVTLPASDTTMINRDVHVKKTDAGANAVTIFPRGTDTIDGLASIAITTDGQSFHLLADGLGKWRVLSTVAASSSGGVVSPATAAPIIVNLTAAAVGTLVKYAREDHRHLFDVTINPTWTGTHAWSPTANAVPVTINKTAGLTSAALVRVLDTDTTPLVGVDNAGLVSVNCEPDTDTMVTIEGIEVAGIPTGPLAWYKADAILGLVDGDVITSWPDSSGNAHHLTATGKTSVGGVTAVRPKWYAATGVGGRFVNLPCVYSESSIGAPSPCGYFTIDTGYLALTRVAGWTFGILIRNFSTGVSDGYFLGADTNFGDSNDDYTAVIGTGSNLSNWYTEDGFVIEAYANNFAHTDGNDTERIILRSVADPGGTVADPLRAWVDGTIQAAPANNARADMRIRQLFAHIIGSTYLSIVGRTLAELIIYDRALSDGEVAALDVYLAARLNGTPAAVVDDLVHWNASGGTLSRIDGAGRFGFGTAPAAPIHVLALTEQTRLGYNATNYLSITINSGANATFNLVASAGTPAFTFADPVNITGALGVTGDITILGSGSSLFLPATTDANTGVIFQDGIRILHAFGTGTNRNLFIGKGAGNFTLTPGGNGNTSVGEGSLDSLTTGAGNSAFGFNALTAVSSGGYNFGMGYRGLFGTTTGGDNVGIGSSAGETNVSGSYGLYLGSFTDVTTGAVSNVVAIGFGTKVDAANKVVIGNTNAEITTETSGGYTGGTTLVELRGELALRNPVSGFYTITDTSLLTADRTYTFPNDSGTFWLDNLTTGLTAIDDPVLTWTPVVIKTGGGGWKVWGVTDPFGSSAYFQMTQAATGKVTAHASGGTSSGQWLFTGTGTPVVTVDGSTTTRGLDLSTSGRINSQVADAVQCISFLMKSDIVLTSPAAGVAPDRYHYKLQDNTGTSLFQIAAGGSVGMYITHNSGVALLEIGASSVSLPSVDMALGVKFGPRWGATAGTTLASTAGTVCAGYFSAADNALTTATTLVGGFFTNQDLTARAHTNLAGAWFRPFDGSGAVGAVSHGSLFGWKVFGAPTAKNSTATAAYGGYVSNMLTGTTPATIDSYGLFVEEQTQATNKYGLWLANATSGYKAVVVGNANAYLGGIGGELALHGATFNIVFYDNDIVSYDDDLVTY